VKPPAKAATRPPVKPAQKNATPSPEMSPVQMAAAELLAVTEAKHGSGNWYACNIELAQGAERLKVVKQEVCTDKKNPPVHKPFGHPADSFEARVLESFQAAAATKMRDLLANDGVKWAGLQLELNRAQDGKLTFYVVNAFDSPSDEQAVAVVHVATQWMPPQELLKQALEDEIRSGGIDAQAAKASLAADLAPTAISAAEKAGNGASIAEEAERGARVGLEVQAPWSEKLLDGSKTVETRKCAPPAELRLRNAHALRPAVLASRLCSRHHRYALPNELVGKPVALIGTAKGEAGVSALADAVPAGGAQLLGEVTFGECFRYASRAQWREDESRHGVAEGARA
jgi:hypothetical protein